MWAVKYRVEFDDQRELLWTVDISEDAFVGDITYLKASGNPLTIYHDNEGDDIFSPIRSSSANIQVYSEENFILADLTSSDDMKFLVQIYQGAGPTLYWTGFLVSDEYEEIYDQPPYIVKLVANDGLNILKDIEYKDGASYYTGRYTEVEILRDIFGKLDPYLTDFYEYVNIYDDLMASTVADSPMEFTTIETDIFKDLTCYEVLGHILTKYNAVIRQEDLYRIFRPTELKGTTVYGRKWTGDAAKANDSYTPLQKINRLTDVTNIQQVPGGVMMTQSPVEKVTINQDYGYKESWIKDWQFKAKSYDTVAEAFDNWTNVPTIEVLPLSDFLVKEDAGCALQAQDGGGTYIYQDFAPDCKYSATDRFVIEFDYNWYNDSAGVSGATDLSVTVRMPGYYYLLQVNDTEAEWSVTPDSLMSVLPNDVYGGANIPAGWGDGWIHFKREFTGLPTGGPITIVLDSQLTDPVYNCYRNINIYTSNYEVSILKTPKPSWFEVFWLGRFEAERREAFLHPTKKVYEDLDEIVQKEYVVDNTINGNLLDYNYILGDVADTGIQNILEQFAGALGILYDSDTWALAAARFETEKAADYAPGGVIVTSGGNDIIFTSDTAGVDFTGATTITNLSGDLDGFVVNTTANQAEQVEIDTVTLTGTGGTANVTCDGLTKLATFAFDLDTTAQEFTNDHGAAYDAIDITLTDAPGGKIIFTGQAGKGAFTGATSVANVDGDLAGTNANTQAYSAPVARVDTVTLNAGTTGYAWVECDDVTKIVYLLNGHRPSTNWNTRGGSEDKPLLEIIGDEIAAQGIIPQHLIQVPLMETASALQISTIGSFRDDLQVLNELPEIDIKEVADWTKVNSTLAINNGYARFISTAGNPYIWQATNFEGADHYLIRFKYKVIAGNPDEGKIFYKIDGGHDWEGGFYKSTGILNNDGEWHTLDLDMSDLTAGGDDWVTETITGIRFDIVNITGITIDFDYLGFCKCRNYLMNRGKFHVKDRLWDIDLMEIL